jgi:RNA polymerase sigma factor (TIGR02999 family)
MLDAAGKGDASAADQLLPIIYNELRDLAARKLHQENVGHTLQATALVHEAYLRLVDVDRPQDWNGRGHFFAAAAEAMRRLLIERARHKKRLRHGGDFKRVDLDSHLCISDDDEMVLALDEALTRLAAQEPQAAEVVKLRYYAGLTIEETAAALDISTRTVNRHWTYARAWLYRVLEPAGQ